MRNWKNEIILHFKQNITVTLNSKKSINKPLGELRMEKRCQ